MDTRSVYSLSVLQPQHEGPEEPRTKIQAQLRDFVLAFSIDNVFIYRCGPMMDFVATSMLLGDSC